MNRVFLAMIGIIVVAACGRVGFDPLVPESGGFVEEPIILGTFNPPWEIQSLVSDQDDADPSLSDDGKELYFTSGRNGQLDIWRATRNGVGGQWQALEPVEELNSNAREHSPMVSRNGRTMIFSRGPSGRGDLWISKRLNRSDNWSEPEPLDALNTADPEGDPSLSPSGKMIIFTRNSDIYMSMRDSLDDDWREPWLVEELSTGHSDADPFLLDEGLTVVFSSNVPGGMGKMDLYTATRKSLDQPFGDWIPIMGLNSSASDRDPWISPDGSLIIYSTFLDGDQTLVESTLME